MAQYKYEALDREGKKVKGTVEVESEQKLLGMLQDMEYEPVLVMQVGKPARQFHYVGKDASGKRRDGSIEADDKADAYIRLRDMGIQAEAISGSTRNLDHPFDDTWIDKLCKGISKPLLFVLFFLTGFIMSNLSLHITSKQLADSASRVAEGKVVQHSGGLVQYFYEAGGKQYTRWGRFSGEENSLVKGAPIMVRHSIQHPSISRPENAPAPRPAPGLNLYLLILVSLVLLLFLASAFHYIGRLIKSWSGGEPAPPNDIKRLLTNAVNSVMFPLIFACVTGSFMGQDKVSFYYPYRGYFIIFAVALLGAALYIRKKSPVYYD